MSNEILEKISEYNQASVERFLKLNQITSTAVERLAKQQLAIMSESIQAAGKQAQSVNDIRSLQDLLDKQSGVATDFVELVKGQAQECINILLDAQAQLNGLIEEGMKSVSPVAKAGTKAA